jgi:hypothetical protein
MCIYIYIYIYSAVSGNRVAIVLRFVSEWWAFGGGAGAVYAVWWSVVVDGDGGEDDRDHNGAPLATQLQMGANGAPL